MKEKQITRSNSASSKPSFNRKRKTSNRIFNGSRDRKNQFKILRKERAGVLKVSKAAREEMREDIPAEILRTCNDLKQICIKIDKLEKEKQKLLLIILKDVSQTKQERCYL